MAAEPKKDDVTFVSKEEEESMAAGAADAPEDERMSAVGPDGEIDWDCPCLEGMVNGPCGENFKEAFACFVHSTAEPKGDDCMVEFKGMYDCIQAHPEEYGEGDEESAAESKGDEEKPADSSAPAGEPAGGSDNKDTKPAK